MSTRKEVFDLDNDGGWSNLHNRKPIRQVIAEIPKGSTAREEIKSREFTNADIGMLAYLAFSKLISTIAKTLDEREPLSKLEHTNLFKRVSADLIASGAKEVFKDPKRTQAEEVLKLVLLYVTEVFKNFETAASPSDLKIGKIEFDLLKKINAKYKLVKLAKRIVLASEVKEDPALLDSTYVFIEVRETEPVVLTKDGDEHEEPEAKIYVWGRNKTRK